MKNTPKKEEILLNNKIPIYKITINKRSIFEKKDQTFRWYFPNWNKIINEGHLINLLVERKFLKREQSKFCSSLTQVYLLLTFLSEPFAKRKNYTGRRNRKFNINTLLFDPVFNESLFDDYKEGTWKIKSLIRNLTKSEKEKKLDEILKTKVYPWLDIKTPLNELINDAFFEKTPLFPLSKIGDDYFTNKVFHNAITILKDKFIGRDLTLNPLSIKDISYIHNNILPDPIIEELRDKKLTNILENLEVLYRKFFEQIEGQKQNGFSKIVVNLTLYKNDYLTLTQELIEYLRAKQKRKFSKAKITELDEVVNFVIKMKNLPDQDKWKGLLLVRDRFYPQAESLYAFTNKLEIEVKKQLRNFSLQIHKDLIAQENLSREEVRLFILTNLGLRSLNYSIPIFDKGLIEFFNFNRFILPLFIEVVLNRITQYDSVNLKEFLDYQFRIFLKFYPAWHQEIKFAEKERKRHTRAKQKTKRLNIAYDEDKTAPNPADRLDIINSNEELLKICTEREVKVFTEKEVFNKPLTVIADEQRVSPQMIGKIYRRAKQKIQKHYLKE